jgi:pyrimidine-nucleoside phosphorylase
VTRHPITPAERLLTAIEAKRAGRSLIPEVISSIIHDYTAGRIPDYQMAAWLMAVTCQGMDMAETLALTRSYVDSGDRIDLSSVRRTVVDKHSTGGVGDKVTLFVAPVVASLGVGVLKMTGRGLGYAGGTLDKLESIPGLRMDLSEQEMLAVLEKTGMVITGQTARLVPADAATYALRDVTGTVTSAPLIAASIMSKKIAAATSGAVLDVKFGSGGLVDTYEAAEHLATIMVELGAACDLPCVAVLSDVHQPLGRAIGNALEVREALEALRGVEVPGFSELARLLAGLMLRLADPGLDERTANERVRAAVADGSALAVFQAWVAAQGGDPRCAEEPDSLPRAPYREVVTAPTSGWVHAVDARQLGRLSVRLGAGRLAHAAPIDHAVGLIVRCRIADQVHTGEPIAEIHMRDGDRAGAQDAVRAAFDIRPQRLDPLPSVHRVIGM